MALILVKKLAPFAINHSKEGGTGSHEKWFILIIPELAHELG